MCRMKVDMAVPTILKSVLEEQPVFRPVEIGTDLGDKPPNFLRYVNDGDRVWDARAFAYKIPTGFSSFPLTRGFERFVGVTNFVSDAENIKKLIRLPHSSDSVSLLMHRVGNSILVDNFDMSTLFLQNFKGDWEWLSKYAKKVAGKDKDILFWENRKAEDLKGHDCLHKLIYYSLNEKLKFKSREKVQVPNRLERPVESMMGSQSFLSTLSWEFAGYSFLLGSDIPVLQGPNESTLTLRENDASKSFTLSTLACLDSWIDNTMVGANQTYIAHHKDDVVVKNEFIKTDSFPIFGSFDKNEVCEKSQQLFKLINEKVSHGGHSYWFYKRPGCDIFEIHDLSHISMDNEYKIVNPIMPSIAALLYRICDTCSSEMPPTTVLAMMRHFISIFPEEEFPLLAVSALYQVACTSLNSNFQVFTPQLRLLSGPDKPVLDFEYLWHDYSKQDASSEPQDIFSLEYQEQEDSHAQDDLNLFNEFLKGSDWRVWERILELDRSHVNIQQPCPQDFPDFEGSSLANIRRSKYALSSSTTGSNYSSQTPVRSGLAPDFFPEKLKAPDSLKELHPYLKTNKCTTGFLVSPKVSAFTSHHSAFTATIQKQDKVELDNATKAQNYPSLNMTKRNDFFRRIKSKFSKPSAKSTSPTFSPRPLEWFFYRTCKHLFRLFSSIYCIINDAFDLKSQEHKRKKGSSSTNKSDEKHKKELTSIINEKVALLFLCMAYFGKLQDPCNIFLGQFCVRLIIFLNERGPRAVSASAWKIGGDMLSTHLGEGTCEFISKKLCKYEDIVRTQHPDLGFLFYLSKSNRKIENIVELKGYDDNFNGKSRVETAVLYFYDRAMHSVPPHLENELKGYLGQSFGKATVEYFRMCQAKVRSKINTDLQLLSKGFKKSLSEDVEKILEYLERARSKWTFSNDVVHMCRMKVYEAEVQYFQDAFLGNDSHLQFKMKAMEEYLQEITKISTDVENLIQNNTAKQIPNLVDEIRWKKSVVQLIIANYRCDALPTLRSVPIKSSREKSNLEEVKLLLNSALDNVKRGGGYPSNARQLIHTARIYERIGILHYTLARMHGWEHKPTSIHELDKSKNHCLYGKYALPNKPDPSPPKPENGVSEGFAEIKEHLSKAQQAFHEEAMIYTDLKCFKEFVQAYFCYMDCRLASSGTSDEEKSPLELSMLCGIRKYLPLCTNECGKICLIKEYLTSDYNYPSAIGSSLNHIYQFEEILSSKSGNTTNNLAMMGFIARRLNKCVMSTASLIDPLDGHTMDNFIVVRECVESMVGRVNEMENAGQADVDDNILIHMQCNMTNIVKMLVPDSKMAKLMKIEVDEEGSAVEINLTEGNLES